MCPPAPERTAREVVAAVAAVMGIKLFQATAETAPIAVVSERLRAAFILVLGGIFSVLKRVVLPHFLLALGLLLVTGYTIYRPVAAWPAPWLFIVLLAAGILGVAGALGYALLTSLLYALKSAAIYAEDFFYALFECVKRTVSQQIDTLDEGITKQQAQVILQHSVREVFAPLRQLRIGSVPRVLLAMLVGVLTFVSRSVFTAQLARTAGTTVRFSHIFASRATLVGALFLNMRWLAALLLWMLYGLGAIIFVFDIYWMW